MPFINIPYSRFLLVWSIFGISIAIWLAASQPEQAPADKREMKTPDLMDFATEDDETVDTTQPRFSPNDPVINDVQNTAEEDQEE